MRKLFILVPFMLTACMVGPNYQKPSIPTPASWNEKPADMHVSTSKISKPEWWEEFKDDKLNLLVAKALDGNHDKKMAEARILEARGLRMNAKSSLYPQVNAGGVAQRSNPGLVTQNNTVNLYQASFDASWELDIFGGNRRAVEASDASLANREALYRGVTITLVAEVVTEYTRLRELQSRYELTKKISETQRQLAEFANLKYQHGAVSQMEVDQADALYRITIANLPVLQKAATATIYRISVLTGAENDEVVSLLRSEGEIPVTNFAQILDEPADVISRRPDVTAAERSLAANTALTGVAISEMYPKLTLSGLFGWQNTSILPSTGIFGIAGAIAMPILNFGRIQGNINAADARQTQTFYQYQKTLISAVADVETKLSDYAKNKEHTVALKAAMDSSNRALDAAQLRYEKGVTPLIDVLDAQNKVYIVNNDYMTAIADETTSVVALNKAAGY